MKIFESVKQIPFDFTGVCYVTSDKETRYSLNGLLHREDGPALIRDTGRGRNQTWYMHGKKHRLDGPAYITKYYDAMGLIAWYINDELMDSFIFDTLPIVVLYKLKKKADFIINYEI